VVPTTENGKSPAAVPVSEAMVRREDAPAVTAGGDKVQRREDGNPVTVSRATSAAPETTVVRTSNGTDPPESMLCTAGSSEMTKSFRSPQPPRRNAEIRLAVPVFPAYDPVYQNVQSSTGSICSEL
jgi:hypothetical protein